MRRAALALLWLGNAPVLVQAPRSAKLRRQKHLPTMAVEYKT